MDRIYLSILALHLYVLNAVEGSQRQMLRAESLDWVMLLLKSHFFPLSNAFLYSILPYVPLRLVLITSSGLNQAR